MKHLHSLILVATLAILSDSCPAKPLQFTIAEEEQYAYVGNERRFAYKTRGRLDWKNGLRIMHIIQYQDSGIGGGGEEEWRSIARALKACARASEQREKFEKAAGKVTVRTTSKHKWIEFEVRGIGRYPGKSPYITAQLPYEEALKFSSAITATLDAAKRINALLDQSPIG